ncbi:hypothetical protein QUG53_24025, partial [Enterobacter asburiae]
YEYDESVPFAIVRDVKQGRGRKHGRKAVGFIARGKSLVRVPNCGDVPASVIAWILHNGDIPDGYTIALQDPADSRLSNATLITVEKATERRKAARVASASGTRSKSTLPRGIVERVPGYYVASFMRKGKRTHKAGRDLESLTLWLVKERDGFNKPQLIHLMCINEVSLVYNEVEIIWRFSMKHTPTQKEIVAILNESRKAGSFHLCGSREERKAQL